MSASMSSATNRRIASHQHPPHHVERLLAGPAPDAFAVPGKAPLQHFLLVAISNGNPYQADRLLFRTPAGTCDSRHANADVGIADFPNVFGQRQCDLLAHRAMSFD